MSEFWVSGKKTWCKFCKIFVTDNRSSRLTHDTGKKHKDNVQRYLRTVENQTIQDKYEKEKLRLQLEKIERDALKQYISEAGGDYRSIRTEQLKDKDEAIPKAIPKKVSRSTKAIAAQEQISDSTMILTEPNLTLTIDSTNKPVLETQIGNWEIVPKSLPTNIFATEKSNDKDDTEDLSDFKFEERKLPDTIPKLFMDTDTKEEPLDVLPTFKKRKTKTKPMRKQEQHEFN